MTDQEIAQRKIESDKWEAQQLATAYKASRMNAYHETFGSLEGQLDYIYHNGLDGWKAEIKKIKDAYPKPV